MSVATATLTIINPGTGEPVGEVPAASPADVDAAVRNAHAAQAAWGRLGYSDRGAILHACAEAFEAHVEELVPILVAEQGKTIREAKIELHKAADTLEHYAGMQKQVRGVYVHGLDAGVDGRVLRRPLGVTAAIVPWNFPTTLLCNKLGPALLCGNTVVAKPADSTPFTTLRLGEILTAAGLPDGVLTVLPGTGAETGEALVTHPLVRKVAFTGSTLAIKRLYVFESVADEVIQAVAAKAAKLRIGIGSEPGSQIGPLHSERQIAESGGEILAGGGRPEDPALANGWFHEPTVVLEPGHDSPMAQEEVFGPALPIWRVRDMDEAIERANDSPFGLGSSVWTADLDRAERAAGELDCGYTWINSPTKVYDELPFGGLKASGYGKEQGSEACDSYTDTKSVVVKRA